VHFLHREWWMGQWRVTRDEWCGQYRCGETQNFPHFDHQTPDRSGGPVSGYTIIRGLWAAA